MKLAKITVIVSLVVFLIFFATSATLASSNNSFFNNKATSPREVRWEIVGLEIYACVLRLPTGKIYKKNIVTLILARPEKNPSVPFFVKMDTELLAYFLRGLRLENTEQIIRKRRFIWGHPKNPVPAINRLIKEGRRQ